MRLRAPLLLSVLALLLQACSYAWNEDHLEANIVRPGNFIKGSGVIQSVGTIRGAREPGTGADAQGKRPDRNLYRLYLKMDGGGFQAVDIDSSRFLAGEAVELTNDGRVVRVSGTSLKQGPR
jgi:hypothetical protein